MNRTHAFFALAAALTLSTLFQPVARWWERRQLAPIQPATHAQSGGPLRLEAALTHGRPLEGGRTYLRYDVRATDARPTASTQPVQMALVLDRSGSMAGEKIARARAAALSLVDLLTADDQLAVVTFGSNTDELPLTRADEAGKEQLRAFINQMVDSGGTNISAALDRAQALLEQAPASGARRVVLVSDGQPTEGRTRPEELVQQTVAMHEKQIAISALGVGYDFNGALMQQLASRGGGFYAYLNQPERLAEVLKLELAQARGAVARNVVLRLELSGGATVLQVAGREVTRTHDAVLVPLPDFAPNASAQIYVELDVPAGVHGVQVGARLEYFDAAAETRREGSFAQLAAPTTDDAAIAEQSKDGKVADECIRAVGSTQMVAAAAAFERGDRASAFELLTNARRIFGASADALAGDISEASATQSRWEKTYDRQSVAHESKSLQRKKMLNFGDNNAY